ncbi:MAG: TraR/DksA C4-type zinc finger protein [Dehalococcoidia bacterium]|nr:TraR/DksA C4-type zinc finger protein [Dehalococcoidia bacterium]
MAVDLAKFRRRLKSEQSRLLKEIEQSTTEASLPRQSSDGSPFGKREEEANVTFEMGKRAALDSHLQKQLQEVEQALQKIKDGTYGLCAECGKKINPARLEALPHATLCMDCKSKRAENDNHRFSSR